MSAVRIASWTIRDAAARAASTSGESRVSHRTQALASATAAVIGWFTSCAREAVSAPMVVTRFTCARSACAWTERFFNALLLGQGGDQREGQNDKRSAGNHQRPIGLIEACVSLGRVDGAVSGKDGRSHRRVVHTGNRQAHDVRGNELSPKFRGSECQPQGRRRRADRYGHGERNE